MGRGKRAKETGKLKKTVYIYGIIMIFCIIATTISFAIYNNKMKENLKSSLTAEQITGLIPDLSVAEIHTEQASTQISKNIEETIQDLENVITEDKTENEETSQETVQTKENIVEEMKVPDPEFEMPVEGETSRKFAKDNLIFSETLQEWVTHVGIDIKADRTAIVKAAEDGKVIAIKNDPRYGLTIIIEHVNNFKTIYSNLLTTEFVTEGEQIEKGQSIGTVGNSAIFEIADEPHLHFEIVKDDINVDPDIYLQ